MSAVVHTDLGLWRVGHARWPRVGQEVATLTR